MENTKAMKIKKSGKAGFKLPVSSFMFVSLHLSPQEAQVFFLAEHLTKKYIKMFVYTDLSCGTCKQYQKGTIHILIY